jgi:hypothetical protein
MIAIQVASAFDLNEGCFTGSAPPVGISLCGRGFRVGGAGLRLLAYGAAFRRLSL